MTSLMGWLDWLKRKPRIRDEAALSVFIDENAAFLAQKGIYEYSRARAGHYAKVLFGEPEFLMAVDEARWRAYPITLAMVAEAIEAALADAGADRGALLAPFSAAVLAAFDRYPVPAPIGAERWRDARATLALRLSQIGLHPPKRIMDIPEPLATSYFECMPIHEKLRGRDFPTTRNYLSVTLCNVHEEFGKRADMQALIGALSASREAVE